MNIGGRSTKFFKHLSNIQRIFGYVCFEYPSKSFKMSIFGVLMCFANILFNLKFIYETIKSAAPSIALSLSSPSSLVVKVMLGTFMISLLCTCLILVLNFLMRKELFDLFTKFEILDEQVTINQFKINSNNLF